MRKLFLLLSMIVAMTTIRDGLAQSVACIESYRFDSYGVGLATGYEGRTWSEKPIRFKDDFCFILGLRRGREIAAMTCRNDFLQARSLGRQGGVQSAGSTCYVEGFRAGLSELRMGAREHILDWASEACHQAYWSQYERGRTRRGQVIPTMPHDLRECAQAGYYDGQWIAIENLAQLLGVR
jgi:hypothetical protein